jgi:hypothetical protein
MQLTKAFLNPLERYVTRLMPLRKNISALKVHPSTYASALTHTRPSPSWHRSTPASV